MRRTTVVPLAALLLAAACTSTPAPALKALNEGGGTAGESHMDIPVGTSVPSEMRSICVTGKPAAITSITAAHPTGGMHITSWGVSRGQAVVDLGQRGLIPKDGGITHGPAVTPCPKDSDRDAIVTFVYASMAGTAPRATMSGLNIHYGHGQILFDQLTFAICETHKCD